MKLAIGTALIVLLAGTTCYAQEQEKEKPTPQQEEKKKEPERKEPAAKEPSRPQTQEQQKPREQQQKAQRQEQEQQKDQAKQTEREKSDAAKQQQQAAHQQQRQQQVARQDSAHNQQAQRDGGNRNARRIPEQDFHARFGREHSFRVTRSDDRRFNYGGYYWVHNEPWPADWAYTDAVYVDEIDGEYYLIDPVHPGVQLLIVIAD